MKPKYRILISAIDAFGHINCVLGFGEILLKAGHEVTFVHREQYKELADKRGFNFISLDESIFQNAPPGPFVDWVERNVEKFRADAVQRFSNWTPEDKKAFGSMIDMFELTDKAMAKTLNEYKDSFDILIGDFVTQYPSLTLSPIPYFPLNSMNPLLIYPSGPPPFSGYSVKNDDSTKWIEFRKIYRDAASVMYDRLYEWWDSCKVPRIVEHNWILDTPKYFGFYHYPEGLDYHDCGPQVPVDKWVRVDASIRKPDDETEFVVPESLASQPGNLIYFSLGSLGSVDVDLMNKFISILSKSPHRFIISKGPRGDEIELSSNMWGENYVNQIAVLNVVDMVITHGGNNTFLETIYFGKPLIVVPYFFDQFDNAQRVVDCGIGRRLDTWDLDEKVVLNTIEETLNDQEMGKKIKSIAESMRSTESQEKAVKMIEDFISNKNIE